MKYDIVIIGFGKAGKTLAVKAAALGKKVALIERSPKMYGGTCINVGCIPTKRLITAAKEAIYADNSVENEYYTLSIENKNKLISALNSKNYAKTSCHRWQWLHRHRVCIDVCKFWLKSDHRWTLTTAKKRR